MPFIPGFAEMCTFISAVLPADADIDAIAMRLRAHGRSCGVYLHPTLKLAPGERICSTTVGHCDCGTPLASVRDDSAADRLTQWRERMRRKGWTAAKIARAEAQRADAADRPVPVKGGEVVTSLAEWRAMIEAVLLSRDTTWFGLFVESNGRGGVEESSQAPIRRQVRLASLDETMLAAMQQDVIYEFGR